MSKEGSLTVSVLILASFFCLANGLFGTVQTGESSGYGLVSGAGRIIENVVGALINVPAARPIAAVTPPKEDTVVVIQPNQPAPPPQYIYPPPQYVAGPQYVVQPQYVEAGSAPVQVMSGDAGRPKFYGQKGNPYQRPVPGYKASQGQRPYPGQAGQFPGFGFGGMPKLRPQQLGYRPDLAPPPHLRNSPY